MLAETQEAEREKWRQAKAAARKKRKEARAPRTMEEEANGLFTELEAAGILTPNTVLQMCEYLEIDAVGEWHLIWIAQACGMPAPVPPPYPHRSHTAAVTHMLDVQHWNRCRLVGPSSCWRMGRPRGRSCTSGRRRQART